MCCTVMFTWRMYRYSWQMKYSLGQTPRGHLHWNMYIIHNKKNLGKRFFFHNLYVCYAHIVFKVSKTKTKIRKKGIKITSWFYVAITFLISKRLFHWFLLNYKRYCICHFTHKAFKIWVMIHLSSTKIAIIMIMFKKKCQMRL